MTNTVRTVVLVYGVLMLLGGIGGFAMKHSMPSLISGIASGILLGAAYAIIPQKPKVGFGLSLVVAISLAVVFIKRIKETTAQGASPGMSIGLCALSFLMAVLFLWALIGAKE